MKRRKGNVVSAVAFVFGMVGLILYAVTMNITTTASPEKLFYILMIIGLAASFAVAILGSGNGLLPIISSSSMLGAFIVFINGQLGNLGYWFYHIHDIGDGLLKTFVIGEIMLLAAVVAGIITVFIKSENILDLMKIQNKRKRRKLK